MRLRITQALVGGLLCAGLVTGFIWLGRWQWHAAFASSSRQSGNTSTTAVALDERSQPERWLARTSIGALVTAEGVFDDRGTFLTRPRPTSRGARPWVVTPLRLPDGSVVAVVRGFTDATPVGADRMSVQGRLQPSEDSPAVGAWQPSAPELSTNRLVDRWPYPVIRDGYLVLTQSLTMNSLAAPTPRFTSAPSGAIGWRNLAYAVQWWTFAAFAVFVWLRQVLTRPAPRGELSAAQVAG